MPARNVDQILIQNWQKTGPTPPVDQWSVDIEVKWTDTDGNHHEYAGTHLFPNELASMPLRSLRFFMEKMIIAAVRVTLGIDTWEDYQ